MGNRHVIRRGRARRGPRSLVLLLLVIGLVAGLAACGSSDDPLASHPPAASPTDAPTPFPHGARDLEARLPDKIGGRPLTRYSYDGRSFIDTGNDQNRTQLTELLGRLGRGPDDLFIAQASDPTGMLTFQEGIFRVAGTQPDVLEPAWIAAQQEATKGRLIQTEAQVAGVGLTKLVNPDQDVGATTYVVARGDSLVLIRADDTALVTEALGQLH
ncbi:MAG TPA: hypothetical protein VFI28_10490 [Candidatus Limnocylindrales bacterium]|nr:hypothetical protein [Candidatus Limnocylindrales bacterium]